MFAVISDIHGNLEAFEAVLDDIAARNVDTIVCLGDVLGYGPNPRECVDLAAQCSVNCLLGNHDQAVLYGPVGFNRAAEKACFWTRRQLEEETDRDRRNWRWQFLGNRPIKVQQDQWTFVHASPRRPVTEYIFPEDVFTSRAKLENIFERIEGIAFVGHTHMAGVFTDDLDFLPPGGLSKTGWRIGRGKAVINVGSVGQPRDRDWRACYVLVDPPRVQFLRVRYDVEKTIGKIYEVPELDNWLGNRLRDGR